MGWQTRQVGALTVKWPDMQTVCTTSTFFGMQQVWNAIAVHHQYHNNRHKMNVISNPMHKLQELLFIWCLHLSLPRQLLPKQQCLYLRSPNASFIMRIMGASNATDTANASAYVRMRWAQNSHVCRNKTDKQINKSIKK